MRLLPLHGPAALGGLALALAAVLALWATPRWQADARQAGLALQQQRARAAAQRPPTPPAMRPDQALVQALPDATLLPQRISALVQLAQQQGLQVDSLRQRQAQRLGPAAAPLDAEQVALRLNGSAPYAAWRHLVAQALQQDDALVLAELRLGRGNVGDRALAGTLHWMLLQQSPAGTATATPTPQPGLPTRAADWPAPPAAALAAWQAGPEPAAQTATAAVVARAASAPLPLARPSFPYRWIGQLDDSGTAQLLLASAQRTVALPLGATLDGRWRLQRSADGVLQAQPLPDGEPLPVPGATAPAQP